MVGSQFPRLERSNDKVSFKQADSHGTTGSTGKEYKLCFARQEDHSYEAGDSKEICFDKVQAGKEETQRCRARELSVQTMQSTKERGRG